MTVIFRTNASGNWLDIGTNSSVTDGTYYCFNTTNINSYITTYYWSVNVTDESGEWANETYSFTTKSSPPLNVQYISPTPDDEAIIYTQNTMINISSNRNLSECRLSLVNNTDTTINVFTVSINESMQSKWGFRYPTTYVFNLSSVPSNIEVVYRDNMTDAWEVLSEKTENDFFNGIECVRFNDSENKAYVSVGFDTDNMFYLKFLNVSLATFDSAAKYYDNRKAAYSLSNDNWGRKFSSNAGAPWQGMTNDASDKYQASVHATRIFNIPQSIAIIVIDVVPISIINTI